MNTLKYIRTKKGYTQRELSEICDVNLRTLQDYEQGHKHLADAKAETVYKLAKGLGCLMEDLMEDFSGDMMTRDGILIEKQKNRKL